MSHFMSRRQIAIKVQNFRSKVRVQLVLESKFRIFGAKSEYGTRVKVQNFRSVRPAGRTHIANFYSNGQPSVAMRPAPFESVRSPLSNGAGLVKADKYSVRYGRIWVMIIVASCGHFTLGGVLFPTTMDAVQMIKPAFSNGPGVFQTTVFKRFDIFQ